MKRTLNGNIRYLIDELRKLTNQRCELGRYYRPRAYRNGAVRFRYLSIDDYEKRYEITVKQAHLNVFKFPAMMLPGCDLLSDSGTTTMTMEQWSQLLLGDEAYGSNEGYFELLGQVTDTFGPGWRESEVYIFHQGRACEHALFHILSEQIGAKGKYAKGESSDNPLPYYIIPNNGHFDTTEANVASNNILPVNFFCEEYYRDDPNSRFKGNIDLAALEKLMSERGERVPLIYLTITNNTGGGQPVSMANIRAVRKIAHQYGKPLFIDSARFAENAWFIHKYEEGYKQKSIKEIFHEMFENADGFHISCKKDGLVNMGGMLVIKRNCPLTEKYPRMLDALTDLQIMTEAHPTYGGLTGRDLKGLVEGFRTVEKLEYLNHRVEQVQRFGESMVRLGIPILTPVGGHAVYIKVDEFFNGIKDADEKFKGIGLTAMLLIAGHRLCEIGVYAFGKKHNGKEIPPNPRVNYVRAAVPRLAYEDQDLCAAAEAIGVLYLNKEMIPGVKVSRGQDLGLRHFKSDFEFCL